MTKDTEAQGVQAAGHIVRGLTMIALHKSRGLPDDHKKALKVMEGLMPICETLRQCLAEEAEPYQNVPDNLVPFVPKGKQPPGRHL